MAMAKRYDHANEEQYGAAFEALHAAGKTSNAEALPAARWKPRLSWACEILRGSTSVASGGMRSIGTNVDGTGTPQLSKLMYEKMVIIMRTRHASDRLIPVPAGSAAGIQVAEMGASTMRNFSRQAGHGNSGYQ